MSILITGGAKGIGKGIALRFASPGNDVFINYVSDDEAANQTAVAVEAMGANAHLIKQDASGPEGAAAIIEQVRERTDVLHQLVHGAAPARAHRPARDRPLGHLPPRRRPQRIRHPLHGAGSAAAPAARQHDLLPVQPRFVRGRCRTTSPSVPARRSPSASCDTSPWSRAADGIRINTVSCSTVLTDAYKAAVGEGWEERAANAARNSPSGRNVTPEDVAATIEFLSGPGAELINGQNIMIDGSYFLKT